MEKKHFKIELRSEKIRSIIGFVPSLLIQWGITIIAVFVVIILLVGYYIICVSNIDLLSLLGE